MANHASPPRAHLDRLPTTVGHAGQADSAKPSCVQAMQGVKRQWQQSAAVDRQLEALSRSMRASTDCGAQLSLHRTITSHFDLEATANDQQQQLAIDVLEFRYQIEREICEDRIRFLSSQLASESEAAKQTIRLTLEEKELQHAHELMCMSLHNEIALLRVERVSKERHLDSLVKMACAQSQHTKLDGLSNQLHRVFDAPEHPGGRKRHREARLLTAGPCEEVTEEQMSQWRKKVRSHRGTSESIASRGPSAHWLSEYCFNICSYNRAEWGNLLGSLATACERLPSVFGAICHFFFGKKTKKYLVSICSCCIIRYIYNNLKSIFRYLLFLLPAYEELFFSLSFCIIIPFNTSLLETNSFLRGDTDRSSEASEQVQCECPASITAFLRFVVFNNSEYRHLLHDIVFHV